jgi:hypothetical protein
MLLTSYRSDIYGIDEFVSTPYGQRNSKTLFFDELPEEEKHNAIFKVLLQNFTIVERERQRLDIAKDKMMNKSLPTSNSTTRKNWRYLNYINMQDLAKCEKDFADFHAGNTERLIDLIRANFCLFRNTSYGLTTYSYRTHLIDKRIKPFL